MFNTANAYLARNHIAEGAELDPLFQDPPSPTTVVDCVYSPTGPEGAALKLQVHDGDHAYGSISGLREEVIAFFKGESSTPQCQP
jgi:hypothetical protein